MNSRTAWGIQVRSKIVIFVKEKGSATTKEINLKCGKEAASQLSHLVETGQLTRIKKGVYEFKEIPVTII